MGSESAQWLAKAKGDLETAKFNFGGGHYDAAAFFCQQAAEKALKAVYIKKFGEVSKTHDLVFLARKLKAPAEVEKMCREISPAYLYTRYPDVPKIGKIKEFSERLIGYAKEVVEWSEKQL